jgi:simple sugar transport system substrate-binding protein
MDRTRGKGEAKMMEKGFSRRDLLKAGGVGIAGAVLFGAAGCGGQGSESSGKSGLTKRSDIRIEMPTHMIPPDPNTAIMQNGAEQAGADMGVDVKFRGPDQFSIPKIQQIFESAIATNPSGIAATVPDPDALGPLVNKAVNKGIPVVLFNAGLDVWEKEGALTYFGQTEKEAGVAAGQHMADAGVTNALCFNHQQGQLTLETRYDGINEGVGGNAKEVAVDGSDPTAMRSGMETALKQNPDVDGVITLGPEAAVQALRAVGSVGRQGSVKVATFDISPEVLKAVQNGHLLFAIDQQMFLQTYASAVTLINWIQYRLSPVTAVPTGPSFVTKDNAQNIIKLSSEGIH